MRQKVLVTGASGFVGSYFVQNYDYEFVTFSFLKDDINTLDMSGVSAVVYLSALVHQMSGDVGYDEYIRVNVDNTLKLAQKAKEAGVGHFVFMSTVKVYGEESIIAYSEDTICNPVDSYGKSKLIAENELQKLASEEFVISIIRTPIVYGKGVKGNIASLNRLIDKISVLPLGGIDNKRSMVYIGNLCDIIDTIIKQRAGGIFLASDDEPISTTCLIELVAMAKEKKVFLIDISFFSLAIKMLRPNVYKRLYGNLIVDNSLTRQRLGFKNKVDTAEGIKKMITE